MTGADAGALPAPLDAVSAVVWDFDGVIADTEPAHQASYEVVLGRLGVACASGWFREFVGTNERAIWSVLIPRHGLARPVDELIDERHDTVSRLAAALQPAWYVDPLLALPVPHHLVSAGRHAFVAGLLGQWGLLDRFTSVRATGSPGAAAAGEKADRLRRVLAEHAATVAVVEDAARYLEIAAAAGATTVAVRHSLNDPADAPVCDLVVDHRLPGVWTGSRAADPRP